METENKFSNEEFPEKIIGNDEIVWLKTTQNKNVVNYTPYYRGHNIDFKGYNFKSKAELDDFISNYILSNQLYNKYKYMPIKELPKNKMEHGGEVSERKNKIIKELNTLIEYRNKQDVGSKEYNKYSERITNLKNELIKNSKMEQGGEVNKKIIVNNYNGELEYTNQDIQEMIDEIDMYMSSDNLPAWLYKSGIAGTPGFPKNKKQVLSTLENIKNSKNDVYININSKEPYYKHVIKMEHGGNLAQENNEMLRNQAKEAKHHVEELHNVVTNKTNVEPWVIAKMERATTDL
jgi:hypothetical protein